MRIHAIRTGTLSVKNSYYDGKGRLRLFRLASVLIDPSFRDIPVYTWAIEHPEGTIVIDTGMTARALDPNYFPAIQRPYWLSQYRFNLTPQDEIGPQLRARGIVPEEVRWVILTHAHFDHTGGLHHFPNAEFIFTRKEWTDVQRYRLMHFDFPSYWPAWLKPRLIEHTGEPVGPFQGSYDLTPSGDVQLIPTPGHTLGHQSVLLHSDGVTYFFAGDTSFDLASLRNGTLDAPAFNSHVDLETRRRIRNYAAMTPLVYLSTHDFETENRLLNRELVTTMAHQSVPVIG